MPPARRALGFFVPKTFAAIFAYVFVLEGTCAATMTLADAATGTMCRARGGAERDPCSASSYGVDPACGAPIFPGFIFGPPHGRRVAWQPTDAANRAPFVASPSPRR